ncbi:hypothetical protein FCV25MIE_33667, partial [Fagus crenata]
MCLKYSLGAKQRRLLLRKGGAKPSHPFLRDARGGGYLTLPPPNNPQKGRCR